MKYKGDTEKIESEFRNSPLYREKWERLDYQQNTIGQAVKTAEKINRVALLRYLFQTALLLSRKRRTLFRLSMSAS